ncbi:ribonuclease HII [Tropicimonas sp. S265A]|uniref:ribonuclease HII n=1 Tax=Tropicimonas sp. S265A TaxID=3415134 RepID=UPI003C7CA0D4
MTQPHYRFETALARDGFARVAGVDEVGRGPLAGPVVAAAVVLDPEHIPDGLNDSKKLTAARREALTAALWECADVAVGEASVAEIDSLNIRIASHLAMQRALAGLTGVDAALIDGRDIPADLPCPGRAIIKGDAQSLSIAAASIVAKTTRDAQMVALAAQFPGYGWEKNAGYPTKMHRAALLDIGVSPVHRRSFKPVHNILYQEK